MVSQIDCVSVSHGLRTIYHRKEKEKKNWLKLDFLLSNFGY